MKQYKVNIDKIEFIIEQNNDGTFTMPEILKNYNGFNTNIKPAFEPITMARKPLSEKTIAQNVLKWGTGGINIDGCRVKSSKEDKELMDAKASKNPTTNYSDKANKIYSKFKEDRASPSNPIGRFPANLIHDGSEEVEAIFPATVKQAKCKTDDKSGIQTFYVGGKVGKAVERKLYLDENSNSASRFFYCAKANKKDRTENGEVENGHPTVKPTALMRYLVRLVTPKGGVCLDPFMGSGSTGKACILEGFNFIGIEREIESCRIARKRFSKQEKNSE